MYFLFGPNYRLFIKGVSLVKKIFLVFFKNYFNDFYRLFFFCFKTSNEFQTQFYNVHSILVDTYRTILSKSLILLELLCSSAIFSIFIHPLLSITLCPLYAPNIFLITIILWISQDWLLSRLAVPVFLVSSLGTGLVPKVTR